MSQYFSADISGLLQKPASNLPKAKVILEFAESRSMSPDRDEEAQAIACQAFQDYYEAKGTPITKLHYEHLGNERPPEEPPTEIKEGINVWILPQQF